MRNFKKILALLLSITMVLGLGVAAFADDPVTPTESDTPVASTPAGNVTQDPSVTITALKAGDTVKYYQVIEWVDSEGWALTTDFNGLATSGLDSNGYVVGASDTEKAIRDNFAKSVLTYITGMPAGYQVKEDGTGVEIPEGKEKVLGRINSVLAAEIAEIAKTKPATVAYTDSQISSTSSTYDDSDASTAGAQKIKPGLYLALIDAGEEGVMYNPVFVSADFSQEQITGEGDTKFHNEWAITTSDSYSDTAIAKKSDITVTKEVTDSDTTPAQDPSKTVATADVGEVLDFKISTQMPEYADNYTWAKFNVTDTLSNGLKTVLDTTNKFTVKVGNDTFEFASADDVTNHTTKYTFGTPAKAVFKSVTFTNEGTSIAVEFSSEYILSQNQKQNVEITYKAKVTTAAYHNVDQTKNEVKVEYSNNPANESDTGIIKDVTTHYSFSLDADINGEESGGYDTSELVKVGIDAAGNWITEKKLESYDNGVKAYPLEGAVFGLFTTEAAAQAAATVKKSYDELATADGIYTNAYYAADDRAVARFTSNNVGKLDIRGLDAGTYYLVETKAPDGFIADRTVKEITITPTYKEVTVKEEVNGIVITYSSKVLDFYTVAVKDGDNTVTSKYTLDYGTPTYKAAPDNDVATEGTGINAFTVIGSTSTASTGSWTNQHKEAERETIIQEADNTTFLKNTQGTELPSTGGIGTTIFYIVGGLLAVGAGVVLVSKKRMGKVDD
ncbi:MAG: LPXTG cell wall anchor domain-containing protein [Ruminococcaceae bacterium]|nr:LPXTG cell wall anchor domain-containing protein [Oscillospiraceae bacterium]